MNPYKDLEDVTDKLIIQPLINAKDNQDAFVMACELINEYISSNILEYKSPYFHQDLIYSVEELMTLQLCETCFRDYPEELDLIISKASKHCFENNYPRRSYGDSSVRFNLSKNEISEKIQYLNNIPQADQRSNEWFLQRHKTLTASSIWKVFGTNSVRNQLIYSKCSPIDMKKYNRFNLESSLHWGQKYEDVSIAWYEREYKTNVSEFGCIPHRRLNYLAASPDGINTDPESQRYGRMVEVKNIVNRDITGIPKLEYWIQMQLQLEVCELRECDFLETRFKEYSNYEEFVLDGTFTRTKDNKQKGIMMLFLDSNRKPFYTYAPLDISKSELEIWTDNEMKKHENKNWLKNIYWRLDEVSVVLVLRNKKWFNEAIPYFEEMWDIIKKERISGYQHRAPNKRKKRKKSFDNEIITINDTNNITNNITNPIANTKCLISVKKIDSPVTVKSKIVKPKSSMNDEDIIMKVQDATIKDTDTIMKVNDNTNKDTDTIMKDSNSIIINIDTEIYSN